MSDIRLSGDIDMHAASDAWQEIEARLRDSTPELVLDLSDVTYMDSSGVAVLVRARQALSVWNRKLVLANVSPEVRRVIDLAGLTRDLGI